MANVSVFTAKDVAHIDKLNGANFQVWKFQTCLMLRNHSLMDLVLGTEFKPDPIVASGVTTNQAAINNWNHKDNTAQLLISATICSDQQRSLITCTSATQMWKRVISQFEQSASENKMFLLQQFLNYQYKEGHDVSSPATAVELMACQLQDVGSPISDDQIITVPNAHVQWRRWNRDEVWIG
ncbi:uncharacterized protein LOC116928349 [Daphnia magna]|uniref:uncharacterized protein LOC116928349 n=1 Tax=Daphnia magna TaxID=35525 RepID=UPI001E1BCF5A|nr:uncharacterized protein LOC116928349 [Daphnia magna]